jgi:rubrerythrin
LTADLATGGVRVPAKKDEIGTQLREAFAREAASVLRCLFYARRADVEGRAVERYTELATGARAAGRTDAADWFDTLVDAESVHLGVHRDAAALGS